MNEEHTAGSRGCLSVRDALVLGEMYCGYAADAGVRAHASSGGIVSSLLIELLRTGAVDSAVVSWITSEHERIAAVSGLAETRDAVLDAAGSAYIYTPVVATVRRLEHTQRRVAVVALPCQARSIRELIERRPDLRRNVVLIVGLFCRGAVQSEFYDDLLRKKGINPGDVECVKVNRGHVSGEVRFVLRGGRCVSMDFFELNAYRTAGIHAHPACLHCTEHLADSADISVGDIFTAEYKRRSVKHSCFVPRTEAGLSAVQGLAESGKAACEHFGMQRYRDTFRKLEAFTNTLDSRAVAARLTRVRFPGKGIRPCHPLHVLSWTLFFVFFRMSRTAWGRRVLYALPPIAVKGMSVLVKGLSKV